MSIIYKTMEETTRLWVDSFNCFPHHMIQRLWELEPREWRELTLPAKGDSCYYYGDYVTVMEAISDDEYVLVGVDEIVQRDEFSVEVDGDLPMWGWLWQFSDSVDDWWLEKRGGMRAMSDTGFRVFESDDYGYFFGIDGAGYDFYDKHWIPLYKARGLQWHDD